MLTQWAELAKRAVEALGRISAALERIAAAAEARLKEEVASGER